MIQRSQRGRAVSAVLLEFPGISAVVGDRDKHAGGPLPYVFAGGR